MLFPFPVTSLNTIVCLVDCTVYEDLLLHLERLKFLWRRCSQPVCYVGLYEKDANDMVPLHSAPDNGRYVNMFQNDIGWLHTNIGTGGKTLLAVVDYTHCMNVCLFFHFLQA